MHIFHFDENGAFVGQGNADADPLQPGAWLIPAQATHIEPPAEMHGKARHFIGGAWEYKDIPAPEPEQMPPEPNNAEIKRGEIIMQLRFIDEQSARPSRAVSLAMAYGQKPDVFEINKLAVLEAKAAVLREELKALQ